LTLAGGSLSGTGLTNAAGQTFLAQSTTINLPVDNQGTLLIQGATTLNGGLTTNPGSLLRVQGFNQNGTLTIPTGLTNTGTIDLTTVNGGYGVTLTVSGGPLTNAPSGTITSSTGAAGTRTINAQLDNQGALTVSFPLTLTSS